MGEARLHLPSLLAVNIILTSHGAALYRTHLSCLVAVPTAKATCFSQYHQHNPRMYWLAPENDLEIMTGRTTPEQVTGVFGRGTGWTQNGGKQGAFGNRKDVFQGISFTISAINVSLMFLGIVFYFQVQPVNSVILFYNIILFFNIRRRK